MKDAYENAVSELKRVDHLYYVSLKYTRTADMMRHMVERIIKSCDFCVESLLQQAVDEKKIESFPDNAALRIKLMQELFNDHEEITHYLNFYQRLRRVIRAPYTKREEFRRHVTMTSTLPDGEIIETNIDVLKDYYDTNKAFVLYLKKIIHGEEE